MSKLRHVCICFMAMMMNVAWADSTSPYAGQDTRDIKALAPEDVDAYLSGKGMGLAKAAELNGYPGPAHVLAMASELDLSPNQKQRTEALFTSMEAKATALGHALIEQERQLDQQFASKTATQGSVAAKLQRIGDLQAKIRETHLQAHLAQLEILTPFQVAKYQELRGYTGATTHQGNPQHSH